MKQPLRTAAFTLVEVIVASGIVVVIMGVLLAMTDQTQRLVKSTSSKVEQFQDARVGFEALTRRLSQATLNSFWDYQYNNAGVPVGYQRSAELRFRSGLMSNISGGNVNNAIQPGLGIFFHAPNGFVSNVTQLGALDYLMNAWGYYVEIGNDLNSIPPFLTGQVTGRTRYRLMEFRQPSENLSVYAPANQGDITNTKWISSAFTGANPPVRVMTENIVALIVLPDLSLADKKLWSQTKSGTPVLAPNYDYNSAIGGPNYKDPILNTMNQLPPVVQVVMVAIDEPSARKLQDKYGPTGKSPDKYLGIGYGTLFTDPTLLNDSSTGRLGDLSNYEKNVLIPNKVSYRVFSTYVSIRGAKWSRSQTQQTQNLQAPTQ